MEFRLTYEGPIHAASTRSPRTDNKHTLRRAFSVETDTLLEPTSPNAGDNDARLVIAIKLKPVDVGWDNISFG